jgi:hypothetical protein
LQTFTDLGNAAAAGTMTLEGAVARLVNAATCDAAQRTPIATTLHPTIFRKQNSLREYRDYTIAKEPEAAHETVVLSHDTAKWCEVKDVLQARLVGYELSGR